MRSIIGVFESTSTAHEVSEWLNNHKNPEEKVMLVDEQSVEPAIKYVKHSDDPEAPEIAKRIGALIGGAVALAFSNFILAIALGKYICDYKTMPLMAVAIFSLTALGVRAGYKLVRYVQEADSRPNTILVSTPSDDRAALISVRLRDLGAVSVDSDASENIFELAGHANLPGAA